MGDNSLLGYLNETFDEYYKKKDIIKRVAGVINYVVPDSNYAVANVQIGDKSLNLLNKTGEILSEGDHVWVYYWHTLTDGYIALRNGEALNIGGGVKNAAVITEQQDTVYNIAKSVISVDTVNKVKIYHSDMNNAMILNKCTAIAMGSDTYSLQPAGTIDYTTSTSGAIDLSSRISNMSERLWSNKVKSYWIPGDAGFTEGNEYTYYLDIAYVTYNNEGYGTSGTQWVYRFGIFCEEVPSWCWLCPGHTIYPDSLSRTGLIFIYDTLYAPNYNSSTFVDKPTARAALAVCYSPSALIYEYNDVTEEEELIVGLACGLRRATTPFYNVAEYNYAIALTTDRDIISSG